MGYQEGQGVGATGAGRAEPLDVIQKPGRTGLGVDEGRKRRKAEAAAGQQARGMSAVMRKGSPLIERGVNAGWSSRGLLLSKRTSYLPAVHAPHLSIVLDG